MGLYHYAEFVSRVRMPTANDACAAKANKNLEELIFPFVPFDKHDVLHTTFCQKVRRALGPRDRMNELG